MAIEFHCTYCGKSIRTGDEHAGKHGKCPSCHQSVYIPTPPEQIEPLKIAPLDEGFEKEKARLLRETKEITRKIMMDREGLAEAQRALAGGPGGARPGAAAAGGRASAGPEPEVDVERLVIEYAISMADGDLEEAQGLSGEIKKHMRKAEDIMQRLIVDEIPPPQLARIPRPVLVGFFKQLREK